MRAAYLSGQTPGGQAITSNPVGPPPGVLPGDGIHAVGTGIHPNTVQAICWGAAAAARRACRWWFRCCCAAWAGGPAIAATAQAARMAAGTVLNLTARPLARIGIDARSKPRRPRRWFTQPWAEIDRAFSRDRAAPAGRRSSTGCGRPARNSSAGSSHAKCRASRRNACRDWAARRRTRPDRRSSRCRPIGRA